MAKTDASPATEVAAPARTFDALMIGPSIPQTGKFGRWAAKALGVQPGTNLHVREDPGPDGRSWKFVTADPADTKLYAKSHRLAGIPRYEWEVVMPDVSGGRLKPDDGPGKGPFDE